ncbi:BREX-1 system adenine-specific DNA-methyltransferase PglX [Flavonifractor plautii]|uniref:BREX-1 system adenine-specific DNA-methyltransferase PglX n=1 Tax=Flavonifractor plautii TaxID=292800 RepID=UPI00189A7CFD|nr:BREX-1 system adenine-specific DNA-methyltransferase PglX [Flavonifractor plautii]MDB7910389.1 BREX-1 system adenine-specific DNA-methyltransferase PglX [Flavonifractor plautii]MDB7913940.1 BREX-1 system adenine-specific DNA-methyltransferase PglX [Flavonifractor plautii]MDS9668873.1 BREX-1 system adenine-specific DNA-methyltransferase PglX [Flavonifractor plautii]
MNKTAIKNFAIWARNKLIADIQYRAGLMGITAEGIKNALPQSTPNMEFYDIGTAEPYSITGEAIQQRKKLVEILRQKEKDSDYATAYKYILEEVAYTWFNRLIAIRFMEVNDYLPSHIRVLSSETGKVEPDLVTTPFDTELDFTPAEEENILRLKTDNALDELFRLLFIKQCNALNEILPALFEKTNDYTELLLNLSVVDQDGVVYHLIHDIDENDFNIEKGGQVEIIGWLYQYYNTEPKNAAFAKNGKITKDEIPAVTQLFTPDWIVRYMVQNSLGRLFIDKRKNEGVFADGRGLDEMTWDEAEEKRITAEKHLAEQMEWKYYLPEAAQTKEVREQLDKIQQQSEYKDVRDIKVIDPCMGSGHILVYAFDVLMQMYEDAGYNQRDAAKSILENNLYGLDIDDRAYQLAYFAVMMKARQYNRRILNGETTCQVYAIQESNNINRTHLKYLGAGMDDLEVNTARVQVEGLLDTLRDAKEYGSILKVESYNWELLRRFVSAADAGDQVTLDSAGLEVTVAQLLTLIDIAETIAQKYDVVVTNPPYMAISNGDARLNEYVKKNYPDSKADLFAVFIECCSAMTEQNRYQAMITQHSWMFLSSFEKLRKKLLRKDTINMAHLGPRAFEEIGGEVVQTTSFVMRKSHVAEYKGTYCRLIDPPTQRGKEDMFLAGKNRYTAQQSNFSKIPGSPVAYWVSDLSFQCFAAGLLFSYAETKQGFKTGDNERFLRLWYECSVDKESFSGDKEKKWFPCTKGGEFRRWYGNFEYIVDWENDGYKIKNFFDSNGKLRSRPQNLQINFTKQLTWSSISSGNISFRQVADYFMYESKGPVLTPKIDFDLMLAYLNTKVYQYFISVVAPTLDYSEGAVLRVPYVELRNDQINQQIMGNVGECVNLSRYDWDSFETSWDFQKHPLVPLAHERQEQESSQFRSSRIEKFGSIAWHYDKWAQECEGRFNQLKANEEELNRIFIDIYGLQDELTPEVEDKDVTVRKADLQRDIKSLLSYAVGCMFGRYSLDSEGLAYAGGDWDESKYKTFLPDVDGIIPITDEEYLGDDIVTRLCSWLKIVYGEDTLEENVDFIAKALGGRGSSSREIIRNYFLKDFFKDHCKIYQKRPIYWLFDSGKQNGFKALIYLHRYTPDTIGNLRVDYLHKMQRVYESEIGRMQDMIDHSTNAREVAAATKRKEKLQKQLKECREYDEMIGHLALSRIELDLDDGVKVNYEKIQTASDGKKYSVLAKI